jgi:hypothetical protein
MRLPMLLVLSVCGLLLLAPTSSAHAQQSDGRKTPQCHHKEATADSSPAGQEAMMGRGERGMGFSQSNTNHHFLLRADGGVIVVSANDPKDNSTRDQIRMHLSHIAQAFSEGDFDIPMFVHDQVPPGVPVMKRLSKDIQYRFKESDAGAQVILSSGSAQAVQAIHDFLVFQIREHETHDPLVVE